MWSAVDCLGLCVWQGRVTIHAWKNYKIGYVLPNEKTPTSKSLQTPHQNQILTLILIPIHIKKTKKFLSNSNKINFIFLFTSYLKEKKRFNIKSKYRFVIRSKNECNFILMKWNVKKKKYVSRTLAHWKFKFERTVFFQTWTFSWTQK